MKTPPDNYVYLDIDQVFCSNFDGEIDQEIAERLKQEELTAPYTAWDWYGTVWFDKEENLFYCMVQRYGSHIDTVSDPTPEGLKEILCDKFGSN